MLQGFSLDPLAIRQVHTVGAVTSGRWNWLINPAINANILNVPVLNFSGWMQIMAYATICLLIGRWWSRKSGYHALVGTIYPFISMLVAFIIMVSPVSQFLLWLGPIFQKGESIEWVMLVFHLALPAILLVFLWRGKAREPFEEQHTTNNQVMKSAMPEGGVSAVIQLGTERCGVGENTAGVA